MFIRRTICARCQQSPLASLSVAPSPTNPPQGFVKSFVQDLKKEVNTHHRFNNATKAKWEKLMQDLDIPSEVLNREMVEDFVVEIWEIEQAFLESSVGVSGCGRGSWCGFHEEVEII